MNLTRRLAQATLVVATLARAWAELPNNATTVWRRWLHCRSLHCRWQHWLSLVLLTLLVACQSTTEKKVVTPTNTLVGLTPSNTKEWQPELVVLPYAEFKRDHVTVRNIRNAMYLSEDAFIPRYYDKTVNLKDLVSVDFVMVPFADAPSLAHTMLSFGFRDGYHMIVSVEARLERGEKYSPVNGALWQYELMYVIGDERDLILLRTKHRNVDVYVYPSSTAPQKARQLFVDILRRTNELKDRPEFYHTISNNCTTNIVAHINKIRPGTIPRDYRVLLPGYSDELAYELGLLDQSVPFHELKARSRVTERANRFADADDFSQLIRRR